MYPKKLRGGFNWKHQRNTIKLLFWLVLIIQIFSNSSPCLAADLDNSQVFLIMDNPLSVLGDEMADANLFDWNSPTKTNFHAYENERKMWEFPDKEFQIKPVVIEVNKSASIRLAERQNLPLPLTQKSLLERQGFISATFAPVPCSEVVRLV